MEKNFLLVLFFLTIGYSLFAQGKEEQAVKAVFEKYSSNILNDLGKEAFECIDSRTIKYYEDLLEKIKKSDSLEIETLSVVDKMTVLVVRNEIRKENLLAMNGKSFFIYMVNNGMIGKGEIANNTIGKVTVNENFAIGQLLSEEIGIDVSFHFYKEKGTWKVDLTSILPISIILFDKIIADSGKAENEFIIPLIEASTARKLDPAAWKPLQ